MHPDLEAVLKKHRVQHVWHFTESANLESIREHGGLLSLRELQCRGVAVPKPAADDLSRRLDRNYGLDVYVRLCFTNSHPMLYRGQKEGCIVDPVWLRVDVSVLYDEAVRFCNGIAYANGNKLLNHEAAATEIDFPVLFEWMDWNDPDIKKRRNNAEKSEILVPNIVPLASILEI